MPTPKQMLIIQHLISSPTHNKNAIFLTKQQAQERLDKMQETYGHGSVSSMSFDIDGVVYFFFSNDHCFGYINNRNKLDCVPCTTNIPMTVKPRECLPSGVVTTVAEYISIFHRDEILIDDFMQLVELIDKHNLLTTDKF